MSRRRQPGPISNTLLLTTAVFLAMTGLMSKTLGFNELIHHEDANFLSV